MHYTDRIMRTGDGWASLRAMPHKQQGPPAGPPLGRSSEPTEPGPGPETEPAPDEFAYSLAARALEPTEPAPGDGPVWPDFPIPDWCYAL